MEDDTPGPAGDNGAGGAAARRVPARASRPAGPGAPEAPPPRWQGRALLWALVVVVALGSALAASFLIGRDPDDIEPSGDTTAFCADLRAYDQLRLSTTDGTATPVAEMAAALRRAEDHAEPAIAPTVREVREGTEAVAAELSTSDTGGDLGDAAAGLALVQRVESRTRRAYDRLARYGQRACGVDLQSVAPVVRTTTPTGSAPATTGPGAGGTSVPAPAGPAPPPASGDPRGP